MVYCAWQPENSGKLTLPYQNESPSILSTKSSLSPSATHSGSRWSAKVFLSRQLVHQQNEWFHPIKQTLVAWELTLKQGASKSRLLSGVSLATAIAHFAHDKWALIAFASYERQNWGFAQDALIALSLQRLAGSVRLSTAFTVAYLDAGTSIFHLVLRACGSTTCSGHMLDHSGCRRNIGIQTQRCFDCSTLPIQGLYDSAQRLFKFDVI